jgi:hypothetical protein
MTELYKATIVSIVPFPIHETKPGIYPGTFKIDAAKNGKPEVLTVGESQFYVQIDAHRSIVVKCPPHDIAKAVVDDYVKSTLQYSDEKNSAPGVFWVMGEYSTSRVVRELSKELDNLRKRQDNWFLALVRLADDDWEKTRQHKMISDTQRYAARSLGLKRPWLIDTPTNIQEMINCVVCQSSINALAIVCPSCKCILKPEQYGKFSFTDSPQKLQTENQIENGMQELLAKE